MENAEDIKHQLNDAIHVLNDAELGALERLQSVQTILRQLSSYGTHFDKIYNQFEAKNTLMELLSHGEKQIRIRTIEVLTHLYGLEAKEMLKANFKELSLEEQISFFELLEKLVVPSDEPFVEKHLFHKDFEIQLLAVKILKSINSDKFEGLSKKAPKNSNPEIIKFVNNI